MSATKSFVCFGAHPDDIEFSCTGMVDKLLKEGYSGYFVIVTNGENGFKKFEATREERIAVRKREQLRVAEAMGIRDVLFLDYRDGFLEYTEDLRRDLVGILKKIQPEIIFTFDPGNKEFSNLNLFHRDHRIVAEAVFDAVFAAKNRFMYPEDPHVVKKMFFFGTNKPNFFFDVSDFMERKMELLAFHESQFTDFPKVAQAIKKWHANATDACAYAETYRVLEVILLA